MKNTLTIYTDGASRGNPGKGGWAAILMTEKVVLEIAGKKNDATNNQMELEAAIQGLTYALKYFPEFFPVVHADSAYVLNGMQSWLDGWQRNNWQTLQKKPVENKKQWQRLLELRDQYGARLSYAKVSGHSGEIYNERCDILAVTAALNRKQELFDGTREVYEAMMGDIQPTAKKKKTRSSSETAYSYVSLINGKIHTDKTWKECEKRVKGTKGARYKKVFSKTEETELIQDYTLQSLL